jgi:hypothetical protein
MKKANWIHYDPVDIDKLYNVVYKYRFEVADFIGYLEKLKIRATGLIGFLKKEYHLK